MTSDVVPPLSQPGPQRRLPLRVEHCRRSRSTSTDKFQPHGRHNHLCHLDRQLPEWTHPTSAHPPGRQPTCQWATIRILKLSGRSVSGRGLPAFRRPWMNDGSRVAWPARQISRAAALTSVASGSGVALWTGGRVSGCASGQRGRSWRPRCHTCRAPRRRAGWRTSTGRRQAVRSGDRPVQRPVDLADAVGLSHRSHSSAATCHIGDTSIP
jgi:hypothetical protein